MSLELELGRRASDLLDPYIAMANQVSMSNSFFLMTSQRIRSQPVDLLEKFHLVKPVPMFFKFDLGILMYLAY